MEYNETKLPYRLYVITKIRKALIEEIIKNKDKYKNNETIL